MAGRTARPFCFVGGRGSRKREGGPVAPSRASHRSNFQTATLRPPLVVARGLRLIPCHPPSPFGLWRTPSPSRGLPAVAPLREGGGMERRVAHPKIPRPARRGASLARDARPAALHGGLQHSLPAMPGLRAALVYPEMKSGHQRAPRTGAVIPPGRSPEAARVPALRGPGRGHRASRCGFPLRPPDQRAASPARLRPAPPQDAS